MDIGTSLVSDDEASAAVEPGEGALDDPAVSAQPVLALDPTSGDAGRDVARATGAAAAGEVARLIGVQFVGSAPRPTAAAADRRDGIQQCLEGHAVVDVGAGQDDGERNAAAVGDEVALCPGLAAIGRVRPGLKPPFLAGRLVLSSAARRQSILPARPSLSSST